VWRRVRYLLLLAALCSLATCPAALRHHRAKQRSAEAPQVLASMIEGVKAVWKERGRFPQVTAGPTPAVGACCEQGGQCAAAPALWMDASWRLLGVSVDGAHRYSYQYELVDGGQVAVVRALGDLDCDGVIGRVEVRLVPTGDALRETWTRTLPEE
jgi:hypothetical protein